MGYQEGVILVPVLLLETCTENLGIKEFIPASAVGCTLSITPLCILESAGASLMIPRVSAGIKQFHGLLLFS